jgi:hypothetical protein
VLGQLDPVAEGRVESRAEARSLAEAAVAAYFADRAEPQTVRVRAMADRPLRASSGGWPTISIFS